MEYTLFAFSLNAGVLLVCGYLYYVRFNCPIYHPVSMYMLYHLLGYVLRPLTIYFVGGSELWVRIGIIPDADDIIYSGIVSSIALLSFAFIPLFFKKDKLFCAPIRPFKIEIQNHQYFLIFILFFFMVGLWGTYKAYGGAGTSSVYGYDVEIMYKTGGQQLKGVSGYVTALAEFIPICLLLILIVKGYKSLFFIIPLVLFVAIRMWIGSQRLSFVVILLITVVYFLILNNKRFPPLRFVVAAFIFLFIFDFIGSDRLALRKLIDGEAKFSTLMSNYSDKRSEGVLLSDFKEFDVTTVIYKIVPSRTGFNYGTQYLRLFVWPIPRQIWPEKPIFTDRIQLNHYGNFWALTWSSHGDYYSNFGLTSLSLLMILVSLLLQKIYLKATYLNSAAWLISFLVIIMYVKTIFRDGGVTIFYFLGFSFIPVIIFIYLFKPTIKKL